MNDPKTRKKNAILSQQVDAKTAKMKKLPARPISEHTESVKICRLLLPKQTLNG